MNILAIETSCDETALAVVVGLDRPTVLINMVASQIDLHRQTNGIVPEVAAREQLVAIIPLLQQLETELTKHNLKKSDIEAIAVTKGPGLIGSLLVGVEAAKTLGALWQKPVHGIHHIEGHIYAAFAGESAAAIRWPVLALVVSGGHTLLVLMHDHFQYEIVGTTRDDAAGEAFDKAARLLGLSYPGGPAIAQAAAAADRQKLTPLTPPLPRPMLHDKTLDLSFSGLKTALYYRLKKLGRDLTQNEVKQYAREVQEAIVETLVAKTERAVEEYAAQTVVLVGGVSANARLREQLTALKRDDLTVIVPELAYTTDNAAMIGIALWHRLQTKQKPRTEFEAKPRLDLTLESVV